MGVCGRVDPDSALFTDLIAYKKDGFDHILLNCSFKASNTTVKLHYNRLDYNGYSDITGFFLVLAESVLKMICNDFLVVKVNCP